MLEALVLKIEHTIWSEYAGVTSETGRHDTVEHIHTETDHFQKLRRRANTHHITRFILWHDGSRRRDLPDHLLFGFTDTDPSDGVAGEIHFSKRLPTVLPQVVVDRALNNAKDMVPRLYKAILGRMLQKLARPADRARDGAFAGITLAGIRWALVEHHSNIRIEVLLNFVAILWPQKEFTPI